MKINGTDIKEYNTRFLTSRLGIMQAAINIAGITMSVFAAAGIVLFGIIWSNSNISSALPVLLGVIAIGLIFSLPVIFLFREKKGIMQELKSRCENAEAQTNLDQMIKKKSRKSFVVMVGIIVLAVIIMLSFFLRGIQGINSSGSENTCGSCEKTWSAGDDGKNYKNIARTGLCKECEANYHSLKHVLD